MITFGLKCIPLPTSTSCEPPFIDIAYFLRSVSLPAKLGPLLLPRKEEDALSPNLGPPEAGFFRMRPLLVVFDQPGTQTCPASPARIMIRKAPAMMFQMRSLRSTQVPDNSLPVIVCGPVPSRSNTPAAPRRLRTGVQKPPTRAADAGRSRHSLHVQLGQPRASALRKIATIANFSERLLTKFN